MNYLDPLLLTERQNIQEFICVRVTFELTYHLEQYFPSNYYLHLHTQIFSVSDNSNNFSRLNIT